MAHKIINLIAFRLGKLESFRIAAVAELFQKYRGRREKCGRERLCFHTAGLGILLQDIAGQAVIVASDALQRFRQEIQVIGNGVWSTTLGGGCSSRDFYESLSFYQAL